MTARLKIIEKPVGSDLPPVLDREVLPRTTEIRIGRGARISIGTDPLDTKVSGLALTIGHDGLAWLITATNRHGVDQLRWGRPWQRMDLDVTERVRWRRVALQVRGNSAKYEHWVLLEDPQMPIGWASPQQETDTEPADKVKNALTDVEAERVRGAFAHLLAWPPAPRGAGAPKNSSVVRRLPWVPKTDEYKKPVYDTEGRPVMVELSVGGLRKSLDKARDKAARLGSPGLSLSDPTWVFTLAEFGLLRP